MNAKPVPAANGRIESAAPNAKRRAPPRPLIWRVLQFVVEHPALIMLPLFVLWGATHLDGFSWDYDEGVHVVDAWLAQQGHPLYTQTFAPYTPGYLVTLIAAFDILGPTMTMARLTTVLYAAAGLGAVMLAARLMTQPVAESDWGDWVASVAAAILLLVTPFFVQWSRAAMSDLPSEAVAAVGVALGMCYLRDKRLRWLFAAMLVIGFALWIKATAIGGAAAIGLAASLVLWERRQDILRAVAGVVLVGGVCALPLLAFDVPRLYEQAIYFHILKRAAYPLSLDANVAILVNFLAQNLTLCALAGYGAIRALGSAAARTQALIVVVWFAATFVSLLFQTPLFANHHPVILIFALAVTGGCGLLWLADDARTLLSRRWSIVTPIGAAVALVAIAGLTQYPEQLQAASAPAFQPAAEEAVALLQAVTPPADLLVSDAQVITFRAQREPPPQLADTSTARLASGSLTDAQLIQITQQSGANGILFWGGRIESATQFSAWAAQNFHLVRSSLQKPNAPYRLMLRESHPQVALKAQFGDGIALLGYDVNRRMGQAIRAGAPLSLTLYFQRTGPVATPYTIFTHALDATGALIAQDDRPPLNGRLPTDQWQSGEFIIDEFALPLPADGPSAAVQIELGMYDRVTLKRAPVLINGVPQANDRVLLPAMRVGQ